MEKRKLRSEALREKEWNMECRAMEDIDAALLRRRIRVLDTGNFSLGYTSENGAIHVAKNHPIYDTVPKKEVKIMRMGVNTHEVLHQIYTDFAAMSITAMEIEQKYSRLDAKMFCEIFNLIEDPAIENFASQAIGGVALNSLYYMIKKVYAASPEIQEHSKGLKNEQVKALDEYISATVHFGDGGMLKGDFTSPKARKYFSKTVDLALEAIDEPNGAKRVELAKQIFEIARPLWKNLPGPQIWQQLEWLESEGKKAPKGSTSSGKEALPIERTGGKQEKRKQSARKEKEKSNKEQQDELKRDASRMLSSSKQQTTDSEEKPEKSLSAENEAEKSDTTSQTGSCEESGLSSLEQNSNTEDSSDQSGKQPEHSEMNESGDDETGKDQPGKSEDEKSQEESSKEESEIDQANENPTDGSDQWSDVEVSNEEPEESDEDFGNPEALAKQITDLIEKQEQEAEHSQDMGLSDTDLRQTGQTVRKEHKDFAGVTEVNTIAPECDDAAYDALCEKAAVIYEPLITQLKKVFEDDREKRIYAQSGSISMKRVSSGKVTTRIFEKRILPGDKSDMCILLLIDCSGSMGGTKIVSAILAATALAETMAYFKIPLYCMGFHSQTRDVEQIHFIRWGNSIAERTSLISANPGGSNFDSYSIRYATELMKQRRERHKIMNIISDGMPSHGFSGNTGIIQNAAAIAEAREMGIDVFGTWVGDAKNETQFAKMYGKDYYMNANNTKALADQTADLIKRIVKSW